MKAKLASAVSEAAAVRLTPAGSAVMWLLMFLAAAVWIAAWPVAAAAAVTMLALALAVAIPVTVARRLRKD